METRLLERVAIDAEVLHKLASTRAERVMKYLATEGQLPSERIVLASGGDASDIKDASSRVVFALR